MVIVSIDRFINFKPLTTAPNTLLKSAAALMAQNQSKKIIIVSANKPIGILTQSDVVRLVATQIDLATTTVKEVMTQPVLTRLRSRLSRRIDSVRSFFQQYSVGYLPILNDDRELIGVIERDNFILSLQSEEIGNDTHRKELARSENLLHTIINSEPECVKVLGRDGTLLEMNPAGLAMIEASPSEAIDKSIYPLIHPDYRQAFIDLSESVFEGKSGRLEFKLIGLKGTARWLETNAVPLKEDDEITALLAVTRDITQCKQTQLQLQQERDFSKAVINTVGALVAILDRQGAIVSFNRTCQRVTGYSFSEVKGKQVWDFLISPEEHDATKAVCDFLRQ